LDLAKAAIWALSKARARNRLTYRDTKIPGSSGAVTPSRRPIGNFREHGGTTVEKARKRAAQVQGRLRSPVKALGTLSAVPV
jgi:hypothetical protein